jgi:hypothetical protein
VKVNHSPRSSAEITNELADTWTFMAWAGLNFVFLIHNSRLKVFVMLLSSAITQQNGVRNRLSEELIKPSQLC